MGRVQRDHSQRGAEPGPLRNRKTKVETAKRPGWVPSSVLLEGLNVLWDAFYLSWPCRTECSTVPGNSYGRGRKSLSRPLPWSETIGGEAEGCIYDVEPRHDPRSSLTVSRDRNPGSRLTVLYPLQSICSYRTLGSSQCCRSASHAGLVLISQHSSGLSIRSYIHRRPDQIFH